MRTKLTLSIDDAVIEQAKTYASRKNRSVSRIVEEYLRNLASAESEPAGPVSIGSRTQSLSGRLKAQDSGQSYDEILVAALLDKHR